MASPCLSSVLTHANLTMYPSGIPDLQPHLPPGACGLHHSDTAAYDCGLSGRWYRQVNPHSWSKENVLEWISDHVENDGFDASSLSLAYCTMDGSTLCQLDLHQMMGYFGPQIGPRLHQNLQELKTKYELQTLSGPEIKETCTLLDRFFDSLGPNVPKYPLLSTLRFGQAEAAMGHQRFDTAEDFDLDTLAMHPIMHHRDGYLSDNQSDSDYSSSPNSCIFGFPSIGSPESGSCESEPEFACPRNSKSHIKAQKGESPLKRPRGRPPKTGRDPSAFYDHSKKNKHGECQNEPRNCRHRREQTLSAAASVCSAARHPPVGVHPGHPDPSREEPGPHEVGGPLRGRLQVPQVGGRGPDVGSEEEERQHDLREAQSRHEVLLQERDPGAGGRPAPGLQVRKELQRLESGGDRRGHVRLRCQAVEETGKTGAARWRRGNHHAAPNVKTLTSSVEEGVD